MPKDVFVVWYTFEIGVSAAVLNFNSGAYGLINVFEALGMSARYFTKEFCLQRDTTRIEKMKRKMSTDERRREENKEGVVYGSGMF